VVSTPVEEGKAPGYYYPDPNMWAPSVMANKYSAGYPLPILKNLVQEMESNFLKYKQYINPINQARSETLLIKGDELKNEIYGEQVKIIMGQRPISDWDAIVSAYLEKGGAQIIQEVNESLKDKNLTDLFKTAQ
jgi:putative aldouronate transport system substrate-binding protein